MPLFKSITKFVVQEMDSGGDMVPVESMVDAGRFSCGFLVRGRKGLWGWRYYRTGLTLEDILEREENKELFDELDASLKDAEAQFQICDNSSSRLTVKLSEEKLAVKFRGSCNLKASIIHRKIIQKHLDFPDKRKLKTSLPNSFRSINREENVYLVTETLESEKEETVQEREMEFKIWNMFLKAVFNYENTNGITIRAKTVLAYRVKQLVFSKEMMSFAFEAQTKSFPEEDSGMSQLAKSLKLEATRSLKERVQDMERNLQKLNENKRIVLNSLTPCLLEEGELRDLEQKVSDVLTSGVLQIEGQAGPLLSSLFNNAGYLEKRCAEAILEFLGALIALSEARKYVAEALEAGTLSLLRDKVESTLEENWGEQISSVQDAGFDPEAQLFYALYVVVSVLLQLSDEPNPVSY